MKKMLTVLLVLCLVCVSAAGCADGRNAQPESYLTAKPSPPQDVPDDPDDVALSSEDESADGQEFSAQAGSADVDLTALSSTMVYAEVYNMMTNPDDYIGRTVKMSGPYYASSYDEKTGQYYHYVIIEDATACCQQGLEFVWNGDHRYPDDYPADTTRIEVTGVFDSYEEFGWTYYHLVADDVTIL